MKSENRGFAILMAIMTGIIFGIWQDSFYVGGATFSLLITLAIIKTVK